MLVFKQLSTFLKPAVPLKLVGVHNRLATMPIEEHVICTFAGKKLP
jgi:hypothetical protein